MERRFAAALAALAALMHVGAAAEGPCGIRGGKMHEVEVFPFVVVGYGDRQRLDDRGGPRALSRRRVSLAGTGAIGGRGRFE